MKIFFAMYISIFKGTERVGVCDILTFRKKSSIVVLKKNTYTKSGTKVLGKNIYNGMKSWFIHERKKKLGVGILIDQGRKDLIIQSSSFNKFMNFFLIWKSK